MVACMKTTVEIVDPVLAEAKRIAAREGTSVRALIEEGLRRVVASRQGRSLPALRRVTFRGNGLTPDVREGSWERIRDLVYEGHGG
jgi:Bacterial antitoxin of type II TA system, VapB